MKLFDEMEQHFMFEEEIDVRWIKKEKKQRRFSYVNNLEINPESELNIVNKVLLA